jgi:PAS domain S-box-containing protein
LTKVCISEWFFFQADTASPGGQEDRSMASSETSNGSSEQPRGDGNPQAVSESTKTFADSLLPQVLNKLGIGVARSSVTPDGDGRFLMANQAFAETFGCDSVEELLGKRPSSFYSEGQSRQALMEELRRRGSIHDQEVLFRRPDGTEVWLAYAGYLGEDDATGAQFLDSVILNTTEQQSQKSMHMEMLETAMDGFLLLDMERRVLHVNSTCCSLLGYDRAELLRMSILDLEAVESPEEVAEHAQDIMANERTRFETRWRRKNGKVVDVEVSTVHMPYREASFSVFVRDISGRKAAEEHRHSAIQARAEGQEQERRRVATELHDTICQTLIGIQLNLQGACADQECDCPRREQVLMPCIEQCADLVRDIRSICYGLYPPSLEVGGLLAGLRHLASSMGEGGAQVLFECDDEMESSRMQTQVEIALFRIAQEAVKNAAVHGRATEIRVQLRHSDGNVILTVKDDGAGFDPEKVAGAGLGMASMRERAEALDGKLTIRSRPGCTVVEASVPADLFTPVTPETPEANETA